MTECFLVSSVKNKSYKSWKCKKTAEMVKSQGGDCIYIKHDVSSEKNWNKVIQETINSYGSIDYLVNNAGQFWIKPIADTS